VVSEATKIGINGFGRIGRMVFQVRHDFCGFKTIKNWGSGQLWGPWGCHFLLVQRRLNQQTW
jgi:hypothetical protein